ncbi:telomerase RNA component interacting RNase-like isoform X2 [Tachypleus tridentatus]|uniref:telomerase RNA component interacting RNase-like isoform X2 n=1 Tax=Tachypleus tridentatus TaxID=6853 RepID=UPI003FCFE828
MEREGDTSSSSDSETGYDNQDSNSSASNIADNVNYCYSRPRNLNMFANDGSFLEMFKKMQEESQNQKLEKGAEDLGLTGSEGESSQDGEKKKTKEKKAGPTFVSKRRGGKVLKTGMVKKLKVEPEKEEEKPTDAWSRYLAEVKKYKQHACEDDSKTRPLVK